VEWVPWSKIGVQQKLMRHADIRTTMNIYGDAATADTREAHGKVDRLEFANA
jgi:integrase